MRNRSTHNLAVPLEPIRWRRPTLDALNVALDHRSRAAIIDMGHWLKEMLDFFEIPPKVGTGLRVSISDSHLSFVNGIMTPSGLKLFGVALRLKPDFLVQPYFTRILTHQRTRLIRNLDAELSELLTRLVSDAFLAVDTEWEPHGTFKLCFEDIRTKGKAYRGGRTRPTRGPSIWLEPNGDVTILGGRLCVRGPTEPGAVGDDPVPGRMPTSKPVQRLDWEVLPPGWWRTQGFELYSGSGQAAANLGRQLQRIAYLDSLQPEEWYAGSILGRRVYYVAVFPGIVVADCPRFGNALYWCESRDHDWKDTFRRTKTEALQAGARRVIHSGAWQDRLRALVLLGAIMSTNDGSRFSF